jgi:hypothetical protein
MFKQTAILLLFCFLNVLQCLAQDTLSGLEGPAASRVIYLIKQVTPILNEPLPLNANWSDFFKRGEVGRTALKEINSINHLFAAKGYAHFVIDSLEQATLDLLASAVVATQTDADKIRALKGLGKFYLDNERKGDSLYIAHIQSDFKKLNYHLPHFGIALQAGTGLGLNQYVEVGVLIGWEYQSNFKVGEYYHFNGISIGAEYAVGKPLTAYRIGYQGTIKAPFYWGWYYLPLGTYSSPSPQDPTLPVDKSIGGLMRWEAGYATRFLSVGLGLTATLVSYGTPQPLQRNLRKSANIFDLRIRFQASTLLKLVMKGEGMQRRSFRKGLER